jgi:hypothetical protein
MSEPGFMQSLSQVAKTVAIDNAGAATTVAAHTPSAGRIFAVIQLILQSEGITDVTIKSGATALTGPMSFTATSPVDYREFKNSGMPVFVGRAAGDVFNVTVSAAVQVQGFAVVAEMEPTNIQ